MSCRIWVLKSCNIGPRSNLKPSTPNVETTYLHAYEARSGQLADGWTDDNFGIAVLVMVSSSHYERTWSNQIPSTPNIVHTYLGVSRSHPCRYSLASLLPHARNREFQSDHPQFQHISNGKMAPRETWDDVRWYVRNTRVKSASSPRQRADGNSTLKSSE